ncbi:putative acetyltransferase [Ochrobactrum sp. BH3]|nr:putative acetyltransferase [Ochrobactrum sp. BH3]
MHIRKEQPGDVAAIRRLTDEAFRGVPYSNQKEAAIINALRLASALTLSMVAEEEGSLLGHVAFSPVLIDGTDCNWYGLGPVSVQPGRQGEGIGSTLIREGLLRLQEAGAKGCVLLGDPGYYQRFGFKVDEGLRLDGVPPEYFRCLLIDGEMPKGKVTYHSAFDA